jgi:hypothetical protein
MHITEAQIQEAAFFRWLNDGSPEGTALENWLAAERELLHQRLGGNMIMPLEAEICDLLSANLTPVLLGPPGIGKTSVVHAVAQRLERPLQVLTPSIMEPTDFLGFPRPHPEGYLEFLPAKWALELPANAILFFDELTTAPPMVQNALLRVTLERVIGEYRLPPGVAIIAAGNPAEHTATHFQVSLALQNRFAYLFLKPSVEDFAVHFPALWGSGPVCAWRQMIASFIAENGRFLHLMPADSAKTQSWAWPSPRSWEFAARLLAATQGRRDIASCVGTESANAFVAWRSKRRAPSAEQLLAGAAWPNLPSDVLYGAINIADYVTEQSRLGKLTQQLFDRALRALGRAPHKDLALGPATKVLQFRGPQWKVPDAAQAFDRIAKFAAE